MEVTNRQEVVSLDRLEPAFMECDPVSDINKLAPGATIAQELHVLVDRCVDLYILASVVLVWQWSTMSQPEVIIPGEGAQSIYPAIP